MDAKERRDLVLLVLLPFLAVVGLLSPLATGIHGTTHSSAGNDIQVNGVLAGGVPVSGDPPFTSGSFRGDLSIDDNTGWVICNGYVRFSGALRIVDANLTYSIEEDSFSGSMFGVNYQRVYIQGTEGRLLDGYPYVVLGLPPSLIGFTFWMARYAFRRNPKYEGEVVLVGIVLAAFCLSAIGFDYVCLFIPLVTVPLALLLYVGLNRYQAAVAPWFPRLLLAIGLLLLTMFALSVLFPKHYSLESYAPSAALRSVKFGFSGALVSAGLVGFGAAKVSVPRPDGPPSAILASDVTAHREEAAALTLALALLLLAGILFLFVGLIVWMALSLAGLAVLILGLGKAKIR